MQTSQPNHTGNALLTPNALNESQITVSPRGAHIAKTATEADCRHALGLLLQYRAASSFALGDIQRYILGNWGKKSLADILDQAEFGFEYSASDAAKDRTLAAIPLSARSATLTTREHMAIARHATPEQAPQWIAKQEELHMAIPQLVASVRGKEVVASTPKAKAIHTLEAVASSFSLWRASMPDTLDQWTEDQLLDAVRQLDPIMELGFNIGQTLAQAKIAE